MIFISQDQSMYYQILLNNLRMNLENIFNINHPFTLIKHELKL